MRVALGEPAAGLEDLDLFLAANPANVDALTVRAEAHARLNRLPQALADLDSAIAGYPEAAKGAIEQTLEEARELRRQQASQIVVPEMGGGGKIQLP